MSILDELKKLILTRHGSVAGVRNIADAVKVLVTLADGDPSGAQTIADGIREMQENESGTNTNPLKNITIEGQFEAETSQLFGKALSAIQEDVVISNGVVTGTSKYITDWTEYSPGDTYFQNGHFLALKVDVPDTEGVTYTAKLTKEVELDSDQIVVFFLEDRAGIPIVISASKPGFETAVRTLDWSGLTFEPEA